MEQKCNRKRKEALISVCFSPFLLTGTLLLHGMVDSHKVLGLGMKYLAATQYFPLFHSSKPPLTQHEHRQRLKELHDCTSQQ